MNNISSVQRLANEYRNLQRHPNPDFVAAPVDGDMLTWHFTIKGPKDTPFEGGVYHGKIMFPQAYPFKPPDIYFMTPNGRFETNKKICLSITSFHPDSWNPSWGVDSALTSLMAFMPTKAEGAVGGIDSSDGERRALALQSRSWRCPHCSLTIEPDEIKAQSEEEDSEKQSVGGSEDEDSSEPAAAITIEEDIAENSDVTSVHEEEEEAKDTQEIQFTDENDVNIKDSESKQCFNYDQLKVDTVQKKSIFMPLIDIPIVILFILLIFLITNAVFGFIKP